MPKYDLKDFDEKFPKKIAEVIDDFGSPVKSNIKQYILTKIDQEVKNNDDKWQVAITYNVDAESWERIRKHKLSLNK